MSDGSGFESLDGASMPNLHVFAFSFVAAEVCSFVVADRSLRTNGMFESLNQRTAVTSNPMQDVQYCMDLYGCLT